MTTNTSLLNSIRALLGAIATPRLTEASTCDLFEVYVFSIILDAARREGATITYENVDGSIPASFTFRTSPGYIFSTVNPYTHAVINFSNKPILEAHLGVRVAGKSKVLHECDILVLHQDEAAICRLGQISPNSSKSILAVECKYYTSNLQLHLARSFMGLVTDFSSSTRYFFVSNTSSRTVEQLLAHHRKHWEKNIIPSSITELERLRNLFQDAFKNFNARS